MKIVLDIETAQISKNEWLLLRGYSLTEKEGNCPSTQSDENFIDKEFQKSVFDPTFSRIICIGVLIFKDDLTPVEAIAWYGDNEKELLKQYWNKIAEIRPKLFIAHNGLGFDLPFIQKRSIIHQVKPTLDISLARYRTEPVYDTMAVWANWEPRGFTKLDILSRVLNVETKTGSGDQVAHMWAADKRNEVADYCLQDTYVTYACYCRMTYHEPRKSTEVLSNKLLKEINK